MQTTNAVAKESINLTFEKLYEAKREIDRIHMLYIISSEMIPDDAYGILFLRKEDADKFKEKEDG